MKARNRLSGSLQPIKTNENNFTKEENQVYEYYFNTVDTNRKGYIDGIQAVDFFKKTNLESEILGEV